MEPIRTLMLMGALTAIAVACNQSNLSGGAKREAIAPSTQPPKNRPTADKYFKLACENGTSEANLLTQFSGGLSTTFSLEGEFCGLPAKTASGQLTVFFVLDMSGSMILSDPFTNGSCGRFSATQVLLDKLGQTSKSGIDIKAGVAIFGNDANVAIPITTLEQVRSQISPQAVCREDAGGTNYEAAFTSTKSAIENTPGQKIVYFISDGLPSVSNQGRRGGVFGGGIGGNGDINQIYSASQQAAEALRAVNGVILDVIYLDSEAAKKQAEQNSGALVQDPAAFLEKIAGSKDRVRLVKSAADLATQITTFDNPIDVELNADSVKGELNAGTLGTQVVKLHSLSKDSSRPGVWLFTTEPFKLFGKSGKSIENRVTLSVNGADGKTYKATAVINFATDD